MELVVVDVDVVDVEVVDGVVGDVDGDVGGGSGPEEGSSFSSTATAGATVDVAAISSSGPIVMSEPEEPHAEAPNARTATSTAMRRGRENDMSEGYRSHPSG